eukprot:Hpha_TRINITY_DN16943_c2_g1::TRINITY_DN16943_c2_g1_i5::g.51689::m.51689
MASSLLLFFLIMVSQTTPEQPLNYLYPPLFQKAQNSLLPHHRVERGKGTLTHLLKHVEPGCRVIVVTDSQSSIRHLGRGAGRQKSALGQIIWLAIRDVCSAGCVSLHFQFVFGHAGLEGNEAADAQAGAGSALPQLNAPVDWSSCRSAIRHHLELTVKQRTRSTVESDPLHPHHQWLRVTETPALRSAWAKNRDSLCRRDYTRVLQLRTGNAGFLGYHRAKMSKGKGSPACIRCGALMDDAEHFLFRCPAFAEERKELLGDFPTFSLLSTAPETVARFSRRALGEPDGDPDAVEGADQVPPSPPVPPENGG